MPRHLDGYQTCAMNQEQTMPSGTPLIMLSSTGCLSTRAKAALLALIRYLTKGLQQEERWPHSRPMYPQI